MAWRGTVRGTSRPRMRAMAATSKPRAKARGNIEKLPSGALRVRVYAGVDPITKRRYDLKEVVAPGPGAERAAQKLLTRLVHQVDERRHPKTSATVNQLLDRYLDLLKVGRTTLARYRQLADLHVRPLIGSEKAGRIDGEIIDSLYAELRRCQVHCTKKKGLVDHRTTRPHECDTRCGPHRCKPLADGTVRKVHYLLSGAFKKAVYWNWLTISPIDQAEPPPPAPANPQPPSAAEAAAILNRAWHNDVDWGTQVWLSMVTGSRRGEICGIRWRHVDLENGVLHMEKAIGQDGTETWEKDTKTHQDRRIVLDPATVELLSEHWERCATRARSLGLTLPKGGFVFSTKPDGSTTLRPSSVTQRYRRLVQSLNIDSTLHALRHYSATELIGAGVDIRTVAGRLGHGGGGSTTLRVYAAWLAEADQRASQALMDRVPKRPTPLPDPIERAKTDPEAPYERIAAQLRSEILGGDHRSGDPAPTGEGATSGPRCRCGYRPPCARPTQGMGTGRRQPQPASSVRRTARRRARCRLTSGRRARHGPARLHPR